MTFQNCTKRKDKNNAYKISHNIDYFACRPLRELLCFDLNELTRLSNLKLKRLSPNRSAATGSVNSISLY